VSDQSPASQHVRVHVDDGIMDLVLDRPERRNALSLAMYEALTAALQQASQDAAVRLVRIRGAGGTFTSGNDLKDFQSQIPGEDGGAIGAFLRVLATFEKPLLAVVEGHAVGIGTTLLLHCDLAIAASDATFKLPFTSLGLVPEAGSSLLLPALAGHRQAAQLLLLGEAFDAQTARECGILSEVVAPEELEARVQARSQRLVELPLGALVATKRLMKAAQRPALLQAMRDEGREFLARLSSPEAMEAFMAFFQKRKPDFRSLG